MEDEDDYDQDDYNRDNNYSSHYEPPISKKLSMAVGLRSREIIISNMTSEDLYIVLSSDPNALQYTAGAVGAGLNGGVLAFQKGSMASQHTKVPIRQGKTSNFTITSKIVYVSVFRKKPYTIGKFSMITDKRVFTAGTTWSITEDKLGMELGVVDGL
jgi:hypothetical protein